MVCQIIRCVRILYFPFPGFDSVSLEPGLIDWFAPALTAIARTAASSDRSSTPLVLHLSIYVTCLCNPEAVPPIPNCDVTILRPDVHRMLNDLITPPPAFSSSFSASLSKEKSQTSSSSPSKEKDVSSKLRSPPIAVSSADEDDQEIVVVSEHGRVTAANGQDIDVESTDGLDPHISRKLPWVGDGGGVAVCASGPASLMRETANAVARLRLSKRGREMGGVDIHTEVFSL